MKCRTVLYAFLLLIVIISSVWVSGCGGGGDDNVGTDSIITNAEGGAHTVGQAQVTFPPGSVDTDVTISGMVVPLDNIPSHITPVSDRHRINLSHPDVYNAYTATISITVSGSAKGVFIYHSSDGTNWSKLVGTVNGNIVSASIPNFSDFVAGTESYTLEVINNSLYSGSVFIFQDNADINVANVMSLVWLSRFSGPNTETSFTWAENYSFSWSETSPLTVGIIFTSVQILEADLSSTNKVLFTNSNGVYHFTNQIAGPKEGSLYIDQDGTIPLNQVSVGFGMSGFPIFAVQAQPNMTYTFTPDRKYWIAFGDYETGEVIDPTSITNKAEIVFPSGCYSMEAVLDQSENWTISCP